MKSNFTFLETAFPVLFQFGKQAETYLFSDSNSCLMKLGMIGETIVNLMFTYDKIPLPFENTAVKRIDTLAQEGLLTQDLVDILHALRNLFVFESNEINNATYVFRGDWETASKLTKTEVLSGHMHEVRLYHTEKWYENTGRLIARAAKQAA